MAEPNDLKDAEGSQPKKPRQLWPRSRLAEAFPELKNSPNYEPPEIALRKLRDSWSVPKGVRSGATGSGTNAVLVNPKQRGNPVLKAICNVPWEFDEEVVPDYVMGKTTCALFLSLRYHNLYPDYIHERLKKLGQRYELRVLLVHVDNPDPHHTLKYLTRICILANLTLMLAWSPEEAGRIIETYKIFEHKPPDLIMERTENSPYLKLTNALTSVRSINRTDAATLLSTFGSMEKIIKASSESLSLCPGVGQQKAARLYKVLHQPFLKDSSTVRNTKLTLSSQPKQ